MAQYGMLAANMQDVTSAPICNSTVSGLAHSTLEAGPVASAAYHHQLTGFVQLAVLALLAFPIWLFGLLIGLFLPRGTFSVGDSQVPFESLEVDSRSSSLSFRGSDVPGISSRPLSDDEIASSEIDDDEDVDIVGEEVSGYPCSTKKHSTLQVVPEFSTAKAESVAQGSIAALSATALHKLNWAKKSPLAGWQQQVARYLSPSGPSTPEASYKDRRSSHQDLDQDRAQHDRIDLHSDQNQHQGHHKQPASSFSHHATSPSSGDHWAALGSHCDTLRSSSLSRRSRGLSGAHQPMCGHQWLVTDDDLDKFVSTIQPLEDKIMSGNIGPEWNLIMDKDVPGVVRYLSYWRPTNSGSTDYLSVTVIPDATAQEIHEFNLDDACRVSWDPMLAKAWLLTSRDTSATEQLVLWLRSFPMGFLSDRLYAGIARKTFRDIERPGSALYGVTKVAKTPAATAWAAEHYPGVVQTDNYFSAWRCRTIPSPWRTDDDATASGGAAVSDQSHLPKLTVRTGVQQDPATAPASVSKPACELILFHHDELKVPEYLSRLAIKVGMWKFVTGMVDAAGAWLEERRARCDPYQDDPAAACRRQAPPLTGAAAAAASGVPESPFSPMAQQTPPAAAAAAGLDRQCQALDTDQLLTPRRLYAVPTAPNLLSLSADDDEFEAPPVTLCTLGVAAAAAVGAAGPQKQAVVRKSVSLRRGHSLEWEPVADQPRDTASSSQPLQAEAQDDASKSVGHSLLGQLSSQQPQQRRFSLALPQPRVGLQAFTAVLNVPGVSHVTSWVQGAVRELGKKLQRSQPTESPAGRVVEQKGVRVAESDRSSEPAALKQSGKEAKSRVDASDLTADADDVSRAVMRDQTQKAKLSVAPGQLLAGNRGQRRQVEQRVRTAEGRSSGVGQSLVRGAAVFVALSVVKVLMTGNRRH